MTDWAIPKLEKLKYTQLFNLHDRCGIGFLSGLQCRDILLQSGLPKNVLAKIWNLSDIDGDGQLSREEFILAMHLTSHVKSGGSLPNELCQDLIPASHRRNYNTNKTPSRSLNKGSNGDQSLSANVLRPYISTLHSSSFEDRRRENYEKGQVELERRRLKFIEQQLVLLKKQFAAIEKQATEAKAKIEAVNALKDSKMGVIGCLNNQLKTIRDQKALLNREGYNLLTETKYLESIALNDQFDKLIVEKEKTMKELSSKNKKIEESKQQLMVLSKRAIEIYDTYKRKLDTAKEKRNQFLKEARLSPEDPVTVFELKTATSNTSPSLQESKVPSLPSSSSKVYQCDPESSFKQSISVTSKESQESLSKSPTIPRSLESFEDDLMGKSFDSTRLDKRYRALYSFAARNPDELTINRGDIILKSGNVEEPGWLRGKLNGKVGIFPEAYVEELTEVFSNQTSRPQNVSGKLRNHKFHDPTTLRSRIRYKTLYAFKARNPDELTINPGDIILDSDSAQEPGWLSGELNGQIGLFPKTYVAQIGESAHDLYEFWESQLIQTKMTTAFTENDSTSYQKQSDQDEGPINTISQVITFGNENDDTLSKGSLNDIQKEFQGRRSQLSHLLQELIETEADYVDDLRLCYDSYIKPLSTFAGVSSMFIHWEELLKVHDAALDELTTCLMGHHVVYDRVFGAYQSLLTSVVELYIDYCSQQNQSIKRFEAKLASDIRFKQLVNECQRRITRMVEQQVLKNSCVKRNSNLPLMSLMLKPMQRITKYSLLFNKALDLINENGPHELKEAAGQLKHSAQSLCIQVNEACKLKEDLEDNERKLRWAQTHIEKSTSSDLLEEEFNSLNFFGCLSKKESSNNNSIVLLDTATNSPKSRQLIKAGSLIKPNSGKEIVLFLFNDLILITKVKGSLLLRVENVFSSSRAQRAYYKIHGDPINLEDVVVHTSSKELLKRLSSSSIEQQNFEVGFSDKSTGASYILSALSQQEQISWIRELEEMSNRMHSQVSLIMD